ncbi:hypothetical protein ANAEL_01505 [Anaerolineales bacterium]|nr:hypothetical protein ANAEL_01505 [Anaerolineales bacterium]
MSIIKEISQENHDSPNNKFAWLDLVLLLLLIVYILYGITIVPFHGDESTYILLSEDYDRVVKQRDFKKVLFKPDGNPKQYLRLSTGSILVFSIGFARDITDNNDPTNKWMWGSSWDENIAQGNMPNPRLLYLARTCSALMGALGVVLFFLTARLLFSSRLAAWSAVLLFTTQGAILVNIRRAMQEGPKFLFLFLTMYFAVHIFKDFQSKKMQRWLYVLLGTASGLTLAAKQDTVPTLVAIYLALALIPMWKKESAQTILSNVLYLGGATGLSYAFFLVFMPVCWGWWEGAFVLIGFVTILFQLPVLKISRTAKPLMLAGCALIIGMTIVSPKQSSRLFTPLTSMIETRKSIVGGQLDRSAGNNGFDPSTAANRMMFLLENTFTSGVMYMEASSFDVPPFHEQIAAYEDSFFSGRIRSPLADGLIAILAVMGGWSLLRRFSLESLLIYSLLITSGVLLFTMIPLLWQRYFLIMQIPYSLISGVGINQVWIYGRKLIGQLIHDRD